MTEAITWPRKTREIVNRGFDSTIWNDLAFRDDDVVISTFPKAGTTWMQQIVGQLIFGGDPTLDVQRLSEWFDSRIIPKGERLAAVEAQTYRRFFKAHLPVDALVFSPMARYINVARDGRDVVWSRYQNDHNYNQYLLDRWNNQPGVDDPLIEPPPADIREFWRSWMGPAGFGGRGYWEHVRGWWAIRNLPNVLLVHYANLKRDLPGEIRRVAALLEISIDASRWDAIVEYCSFDWMKANASEVAPMSDAIWMGGATVFFNRGVNGRWSDTLAPEEIAAYEAWALQELGPECAHWLATGETV